MSFYKHIDKKSGDGLALTDWNILSNAVAGNQGLTLALSASDKIGIGNANPIQKLEVNGNAIIGDSGETLKIGNIGYQGWAGIAHTNCANTEGFALIQNAAGETVMNSKSDQGLCFRHGNNDKMVIKNGNVGIGTSTPSQKLEVNGNIKATQFLGNGSELNNLDASKITSGKISVDRLPAGLAIAESGTTTFTGSLSVTGRRLDIHSNQSRFEGLHDDERRAQLVLSSAYSDLVIASSCVNHAHGSTLTFATYNPTDANQYRKFIINQGNWGNRKQFLDFGYGNVDGIGNPHESIGVARTVLTLDGINKRIGIGTMSPEAPLSIATAVGKENYPNGAMHITNDCILFGGNNSGKEINSAQISAGKHVANSLNIVGMSSGTGHVDRKVDIWAEGGLTLHGNNNKFKMTTDGKKLYFHLETSHHGSSRVVSWNGDNNWDQESDKRLKKNVVKEKNILSRLIQLDVVNYNWINGSDNERKMTGFIAQDVKPLFPLLVGSNQQPDSDDITLTLKYGGFGVLAVGAIKELKAQTDQAIASLKEELITLKNELKNILVK